MPTYEYECKKCRHTFEKFQSMSDEPVKTCPECGGKVKRLIAGGSGIIFKGSGFYVTDSKKTACSTSRRSSPACSTCPSAGVSASSAATESAAGPGAKEASA